MLTIPVPTLLTYSLRILRTSLLGFLAGKLLTELIWTYRVLYKEIRHATDSAHYLSYLEEQARLTDASSMRARSVLVEAVGAREANDALSSSDGLEHMILCTEDAVTDLELIAQLFREGVDAYKRSVEARRVFVDGLRARYNVCLCISWLLEMLMVMQIRARVVELFV